MKISQVVIKWLVFQSKEYEIKDKETWHLKFVILSGLWLNLDEILHHFFQPMSQNGNVLLFSVYK